MQELYTDEELRDIRRQAQYHLGRVLYEGEVDYDAAVSALEAALRLDPDNLRIEYYLGMAIRDQIAWWSRQLRFASDQPEGFPRIDD